MNRDTHDANAIIDELVSRLRTTAHDVVPWFLSRMPRRYFQDTDPTTRLQHLAAILAMRASAMPLRLTLENADRSEWTFIHERSHPALLADLLAQLPDDRPLVSARVHGSSDNQVVLDLFRLAGASSAGKAVAGGHGVPAAKQAAAIDLARRLGLDPLPPDGTLTLDGFLTAYTAEHTIVLQPSRLVESWQTCRALAGSDDTRVVIDVDTGEERIWHITVFTSDAPSSSLFRRIARHLGHAGIAITRASIDRFAGGAGEGGAAGSGDVVLVSCVVAVPAGVAPDPVSETALASAVRRDLARIRWIDDRALELSYRHGDLGLLHAEVLCALAQLAHPGLASENRYVFSRDRIMAICERELSLSRSIADLFLATFEPTRPLDEEARDERIRELVLAVEREVDEPDSARALTQLLLAVQATLYTNAFVEGRYGLAIRFDPRHLGMPQPGDPPYGAFFVTGRGFSGFHVRFRDIARGGVRVVVTRGPAHHALEAERLYQEVYDLASAQELKNKDIPEGGAKAVILAEPDAPVDRCVKAFADGLLDLIAPPSGHAGPLARRAGAPEAERLYLGPDENITPALIEWIVDRAGRRGYAMPNAFMSSKPGAGINHKEYGVTSEGVTVFLEEALREIGIEPRSQPFTVKMTGGPDGDVAGNEIRILHREYGERARIVGIADGSGSAEDPDGLDHGELLRLFAAGLAIARFDRTRLGPRGRVVGVTEKDGLKLRSTLHNRVIADAFIPAGGRPATIDDSNWRQFFVDGKPSSRVIVEGANLFITPGARKSLSAAGVLVIKDSSANKCGVICSTPSNFWP